MKRWQRFHEQGEAKAWRGAWVDLPTYEGRLQVTFVGPTSTALTERTSKHTEWKPLCTLGEEPQLVVVNPSRPGCPVAMWEHESDTLVPLQDSLDDFLTSLAKTKNAKVVAKRSAFEVQLEALHTTLVGVLALEKKKKTAQALALLEPMLANPLPKAPVSSKYALTTNQALEIQGRLLRALGRSEEALRVLTVRAEDSPHGLGLPFAVLLEDLHRPADVLAWIKRFPGETRFDPEVTGMIATAMISEGQSPVALLKAMIHRKSIIAKSTAAQQKAEAERLNATRAVLTAYGEKHGLQKQVEAVLAALTDGR